MKRLLLLLLFPVIVAAQENPAREGGVLAAPGGRFVFGQVSKYAQHQYMLDTQTGRLWVIVQVEGRVMLQPVPYFNFDGSYKLAAPTNDEGVTVKPAPPGTNSNPEAEAMASPKKDKSGLTAEDYEQLARRYDAEGKTDLALAARERAASLR